MADQMPIYSDVLEIDGTKSGSWALVLENGYRLVFAPSISHDKFEDGDTVLMGFNNWSKPGGFAHFCHFRARRPVQDFVIGPPACRVEPPEEEAVFDGEKVHIVVAKGEILTITPKDNDEVEMMVFPTGDTVAASPNFGTAMVIGVDDDGPMVRFVKKSA